MLYVKLLHFARDPREICINLLTHKSFFLVKFFINFSFAQFPRSWYGKVYFTFTLLFPTLRQISQDCAWRYIRSVRTNHEPFTTSMNERNQFFSFDILKKIVDSKERIIFGLVHTRDDIAHTQWSWFSRAFYSIYIQLKMKWNTRRDVAVNTNYNLLSIRHTYRLVSDWCLRIVCTNIRTHHKK